MKPILMNMIMIFNKETEEVLVLDKVKKQGWEGLTFPGGHVEPEESIIDSVRREAFEETGLTIGEVAFNGLIEWFDHDTNERLMGFLFMTTEFEGELISETHEGKNCWMKWDEFLAIKEKSDSMEDILDIYQGKIWEVISHWTNKKETSVERFEGKNGQN